MDNLKVITAHKGANAIIGINFDILTWANNALVVLTNGTAVKVEKIEK